MSKEKVYYFMSFSDFVYGYESEKSAKEWLQKRREQKEEEVD